MQRNQPYRCIWTGNSFIPDEQSLFRCRQNLGEGEVVLLQRHEDISQATMGHYHVTLTDLWRQLPENLMSEYPTYDAFRAKLLIKAGFCHMKDMVTESPATARAVAGFARAINPYSVVEVRGNVIRVFTARSQSKAAMNKKEFQASKDAVLEIAAGLVGVTVDQATKGARSHA